MRKLLFILAGAVVLFLGYKLLFKADRMGKFPVDKAFTVNFTFPDLARVEFTDREKADQARDWLLYTVLANSGLKRKDVAEATFDLAPVRYGFNSTLANFDYGDTRSKFIGNGEVVALIPASDDKTRLDNLAYVLDDIRKNQGEIPRKAYVFEYELNTEGNFARITRREDADAEEYFTEKMGYFETAITGLDDFKVFMDKTDDVTYARQDGEALVLGGRKLRSRSYGQATVEDVAAIWQSEKYIQEKRARLGDLKKEYKQKRGAVIDKYNQELAQLTLSDGRSYNDLSGVEQERIIKYIESVISSKAGQTAPRATWYREEQSLQRLVDGIQADLKTIDDESGAALREAMAVAPASGFSLDPTVDYDEAIGFMKKYRRLFESELQPELTVDKVIEGLEAKNGDLFEYAVAKVSKSMIGLLLDVQGQANATCMYQKARYDGYLQGTAVGMTLFYTDLLAKMWAANMFDSHPDVHIAGFKNLEQVSPVLPVVFEEESNSLPNCRLWFGPNRSGFQVGRAKGEIAFARNATQIFALSSDPANSGGLDSTGRSINLEVQAAKNFEVVLTWWNNHYEEVGEFEPQYQRLNEIMKWSTIIGWLNNEYAGYSLNYLDAYPVTRNHWFPKWIKGQKDLKFNEWEKITFYPRGHLGNATEAIPLLQSANQMFMGGVSLAEKELVKSAPEILPAERNLLRRANLSEDVAGGENAFQTAKGTRVSFAEEAGSNAYKVKFQPKEGHKLRNRNGEMKNTWLDYEIVEDGPGRFTFRNTLEDVPIGEFQSVKVRENGFSAGFRAYEVDKSMAIAKQVSERRGALLDKTPLEVQRMEETFFKSHPEVAKSIRGPNGEWYVQVKSVTQPGGTKRWAVLKTDAEPAVNLAEGWQARTSGNGANASIVDLKWMREEDVSRVVDIRKAVNNLEPPRIRKTIDDCLQELEQLEKAGDWESAAAYTERLIEHFGETPELVRADVRCRLEAGLEAFKKNNLNAGIQHVNDALTRRPSGQGADYLGEINRLINQAEMAPNDVLTVKNLGDMYLTDKHVIASGRWEGYKSLAKEVSFGEAAAKKGAKFIYSDHAAFSHIDPSAPYQNVIGQIREIPGVRVYDISAEAIGKNTRLYASAEPATPVDPARQVLRLRVQPGSALRGVRASTSDDCDDNNEDGQCDSEYTVKGPVYYIEAPVESSLPELSHLHL